MTASSRTHDVAAARTTLATVGVVLAGGAVVAVVAAAALGTIDAAAPTSAEEAWLVRLGDALRLYALPSFIVASLFLVAGEVIRRRASVGSHIGCVACTAAAALVTAFWVHITWLLGSSISAGTFSDLPLGPDGTLVAVAVIALANWVPSVLILLSVWRLVVRARLVALP